ncbi:MAG: hypothetical protein VB062_04770 [Christensenella sp.]|nr:hypothetical protein [Christensenella sp.]
MEDKKMPGDAGTSIPTKETITSDSTTEDLNPSSPITRQALDKLEAFLLDVGVDVWIDFGYDRRGNFTGHTIKSEKYNRFIKNSHRDALGESAEILKEIRRAEYDNRVYQA